MHALKVYGRTRNVKWYSLLVSFISLPVAEQQLRSTLPLAVRGDVTHSELTRLVNLKVDEFNLHFGPFRLSWNLSTLKEIAAPEVIRRFDSDCDLKIVSIFNIDPARL